MNYGSENNMEKSGPHSFYICPQQSPQSNLKACITINSFVSQSHKNCYGLGPGENIVVYTDTAFF
jgi:hypothetical protein